MVHDVRASPPHICRAEDLATYVGKGNSQVPLRTHSRLLQDPPSITRTWIPLFPQQIPSVTRCGPAGAGCPQRSPALLQLQPAPRPQGPGRHLVLCRAVGEGGDKPGDAGQVGQGEQEGRLAGLKVRMPQGSKLSRQEWSVCSRKDGEDEARPGPGRGKVHSEDRWKVEGVLGLSREPCHGLKGPQGCSLHIVFFFKSQQEET